MKRTTIVSDSIGSYSDALIRSLIAQASVWARTQTIPKGGRFQVLCTIVGDTIGLMPPYAASVVATMVLDEAADRWTRDYDALARSKANGKSKKKTTKKKTRRVNLRIKSHTYTASK